MILIVALLALGLFTTRQRSTVTQERKLRRSQSPIYLVNPYGFSAQQKIILPLIVTALEDLGLEVWEPFARNK